MAIKLINVSQNLFYQKLTNKTQMIKKNESSDLLFTTRLAHTREVAETCEDIVKAKKLTHFVDVQRLKNAALLHDIGHTPFGHAGEEIINDLFLSVDDKHYSEGFPGLFRHNINSIRLLAKAFPFDEEDYVLLDSILKHSNTIPKNYNYSIFTDDNILKMNYVFRDIGFDKSNFLNDFYNQFVSKKCSMRIATLPSRITCFSCNTNSLCYFSKKNNNNDKLSCYLKYPFPITIEGTVLLWADEISCFISDLHDIFKYILFFEKDSETLIAISRLKAATNWLKSKYPNNKFVQQLLKYLSLYEENSLTRNVIFEKCIVHLSGLRMFLIKSLKIQKNKTTNKDSILLRINNDGCQKLFSLNPVNFEIMKTIKNAIYSDIHNIKYISNVNEIGKQALRYLVFFYTKHFGLFLEDCENLGKIKKSAMIETLSNSVYSLLSINERFNISKASFLNGFQKMLSSHIFEANNETLSKMVFLNKFVRDQNKDTKRISNLLKREIGYFVASLDENDVLAILNNKGQNDLEANCLYNKLINLKYE